MKRLLIILALLCIPLALSAQSRMDGFFNTYRDHPGYQSIEYGKRMLEIMKEDSSPEVKGLLNRISTIRIINCKNLHAVDAMMANARRHTEQSYELISMMSQESYSAWFFLSDKFRRSDQCSFVMIVNNGEKGAAVLEIIGEIEVKDISKLSVIGQNQ